MKEALSQLFQQKLGLSQAEVESLRHGDPSPLVARSSTGGADPLLLALAASMMMSPPTQAAESVSASDTTRTLERAKRVIQKLKEDLAATDTMVKYIAQVFGACPSCWGMNQFCLRCQGQGKPGATSEPIEEVLLEWVQPALKRVGWHAVQVSQQETRQ